MQGLLQRRCGSCHGPEKQKGGVRLVPINALFAGDSQDWVVVPGKPDESTLLERIVLPDGHEDIMPPEGEPLSSSEVEQIRSWIAGGNSKEQLVAAAMQGGDEVDPRTWGVVYLSLDLTESQRKEAERMVQDLRQQRSKPGRRGGDRADMDQREREAATRAQRAKSKELRGKIAEAQEQLWEALSPEQQEAMREILGNPAAIAELRRSMRRRNAGRGGQRFPGGPGGSGGRGGDRGAAEG
ncbi:MAG: c-type cytochrome domain-containing protein [Phycisphaerales bacterium]|jgi:hypothetical protein|nr:c-type cytochrome domain-containing protein [Phycisphaerales bacterium]